MNNSLCLVANHSDPACGVLKNSTDDEITVALKGHTAQIVAVFYIMLAVYAIVTNLLELMVIGRLKKNISSVFIASLALTDLLMGVFGILPTGVTHLTTTWKLGAALCDITGVMLNTTLFASLLSVVAITLNRYIALMFPIKYRNLASARVSYMIVSSIWIISLLRSCVPFFMWTRYKFYASGFCSWSTYELFGGDEEPVYNVLIFVPFVVSAVILIFCPVHMALMLSNRSNERQKTISKQFKGNVRTSENSTTTTTYISKAHAKATQTERSATTTTLIVVLIFVISYFLNYMFVFVYEFFLWTGKWPNFSSTTMDVLETAYFLLISLNSVLNPVVYLFRNTMFRSELWVMLKTWNRMICPFHGDSLSINNINNQQCTTQISISDINASMNCCVTPGQLKQNSSLSTASRSP